MTVVEKRCAFRALHEKGCFVLPNPWDIGSAKVLSSMGFKALATTSSGCAWSRGLHDGALSRGETLEYLRAIVNATELPVNADFESGFGDDAMGVEESVRMALDTGIAGLSIEDSTGLPEAPLRSIEESVVRLKAARLAIDDDGGGAMLIARAENFFVGRPDINDTITRLKAYAAAGADCLYAPGIHAREHIAAVVAAVAPKPVNLLVGSTSELTMADIEALGIRRVSVGGALARAAWGGFLRAAQGLAEGKGFDGFSAALPGADLNSFFQNGVPLRHTGKVS